jgi:hypothetical protein
MLSDLCAILAPEPFKNLSRRSSVKVHRNALQLMHWEGPNKASAADGNAST